MDEAAFVRLVKAWDLMPTSLKTIIEFAENVSDALAAMAIERNHQFLALGAEGHIADYVGHDWRMQSKLERIRFESDAALLAMRDAVEAFSAISEATLGHAAGDEERRREAEAKLAGLLERLRAHALSNDKVRDTVWSITGGKCFYCDVELVRTAEGNDRSRLFHIDHIVPKVSGGPDHFSNYVPACETCNISKGSKSFIEFIGASMLAKREKLREEVLGR
jgi:hypothetical protein